MSLLKIIPEVTTDKKGFPWTVETPFSNYQRDIDYPKITIITPSYNQGKFLEETIRSVLLQNYPNLEYIIIDGGSTDNSVEIMQKYESWITYWISETDDGQANAINKGLEKATGSIINWLNSDDWYAPNCLETVGRHFALNNNTKAVTGIALMFRGDNIVKRFRSSIGQSHEATIAKLDIAQPSTFFRAEVFEKRLFDAIHFMFDAELWVSFLLSNPLSSLKIIDDNLVYYRLHDTSKTVSQNTKFQDDRRILLSALQLFCNPSLDSKETILTSLILKRWRQQTIIPLDKSLLNLEIKKAYFELAFLERNYTSARIQIGAIWQYCLNEPKIFFKIIVLIFPDVLIDKIRTINRLF